MSADVDRQWNCDGCAPPVFDLPPPPPPPWLLEECPEDQQEDFASQWSDRLERLDSCERLDVSAAASPLEEALHSAAVAVVCSVVLVLLAMMVGVAIFRSVLQYKSASFVVRPRATPR